jgi:hypothetical protein
LAFLGNAAGKHLDAIAPYMHKASLAIAALLAAVVVAFVVITMKKKQPA